jgi:hypothetical protein
MHVKLGNHFLENIVFISKILGKCDQDSWFKKHGTIFKTYQNNFESFVPDQKFSKITWFGHTIRIRGFRNLTTWLSSGSNTPALQLALQHVLFSLRSFEHRQKVWDGNNASVIVTPQNTGEKFFCFKNINKKN